MELARCMANHHPYMDLAGLDFLRPLPSILTVRRAGTRPPMGYRAWETHGPGARWLGTLQTQADPGVLRSSYSRGLLATTTPTSRTYAHEGSSFYPPPSHPFFGVSSSI